MLCQALFFDTILDLCKDSILTCVKWRIIVWKPYAGSHESQASPLTGCETLAKPLDLTYLHYSVIYKVIFSLQIHQRLNIL